jgi:serine/threonine protein kinase
MIGKKVDRYRVVAKIGEGGMGAVFEALDEQIGKRVAIKVLHSEHAKNTQVAQRFINEAKAINVVDNPGVVQVSAFGELPDGTAYIVMELLKGETLNARMKSQGGRMPMVDALRLGRQIASALAAAHEKGIIHRELTAPTVKREFPFPDESASSDAQGKDAPKSRGAGEGRALGLQGV